MSDWSTVKLQYSSWENITFRGEIDTGIDREDWDQMTDSEKDEVYTDQLHQLVSLSEVED